MASREINQAGSCNGAAECASLEPERDDRAEVASAQKPENAGSASATDEQGVLNENWNGDIGGDREQTASNDGWVTVGHESELGVRTALRVHGRQVTLLRLQPRLRLKSGGQEHETSEWACVDSICYHAGGPLMQGDVRVVDNRVCMSCPWHAYLVDVRSGEGLYMDLSRRFRSKGARQRVHRVAVDTDGTVAVRLALEGPSLPSDDYAYQGRNFAHGAEIPVRDLPEW